MSVRILYPFAPNSNFCGNYAAWKHAIAHFVKNQLGYGLGSSTIAGTKFLGTHIWTESDVLSTIVATGIAGMIALLLFFFHGIKRAWQLWERYRIKDGLLVVSLVIPMFFIAQILTYLCGLLVFLILGISARKYMELSQEP